jgi:hypothetical protein
LKSFSALKALSSIDSQDLDSRDVHAAFEFQCVCRFAAQHPLVESIQTTTLLRTGYLTARDGHNR